MKASPLYLIYMCALAAVLTLVSCQDELIPANGTLLIGSLAPEQTVGMTVTRAVDADFCIDIFDEQGQTVRSFTPGDASAAQRVELEPGEYRLKAYTGNLSATYADDEQGEPQYSGEQAFTIRPNRITTVDFRVPMVNCAWTLEGVDGLGSWAQDYVFEVVGGRSCRLQVGETAYFPQGETHYRLSLTNIDGETQSTEDVLQAEAGKEYRVTYVMPQHTPVAHIRN